MELRQLEYFITVAQLGNLTRAAEVYYVSQPNVTVAIRKLEKELQTTLFERKSKSVVLTPEGKVFYDKVKIALEVLQSATDEVKDFKQEGVGTVTIGIPPMIGSFIFAPLLQHFRKEYPKRELIIMEEGSLGIRKLLQKEEVDLGIVITNDLPDTFRVIPLFAGEHKLCVPVNHPLSTKPTVSYEDLRNESLILMKVDSYHRQTVMKKCENKGFLPQIVLSSNHVQTNLDLVAKGIGLSFVLDTFSTNRSDVVFRSMEEPLLVDIGIVCPKNKYVSYAARDLISFIRTHVKNAGLTLSLLPK